MKTRITTVEKVGGWSAAFLMALSLIFCIWGFAFKASAINNNPTYTFRFFAAGNDNDEEYFDGMNALVYTGGIALNPGLNDLFAVYTDGSGGGGGCPTGSYNMAGYVAVYQVVNGIPTLWSESPVFYSPGYKDVAVGISGNTTTGVVTFSGYVASDPCGSGK